jgi:predicted small secreted protein
MMRVLRLCAALFCAALLLSACETRMHRVRYEVDGTAETIAVSYINETGATEQRDVHGPWSAEYELDTWSFVGVSAFNATFEGTVACRLYVDGMLIQRADSEGGFKLASCNTLAGVENTTPTPEE